MKRILFALAFGLVLMAQPGRYGYGPSPYDNRGFSVNNFSERISRGERAGLITRREAAKLWSMERNLRREIQRSAWTGYGMSPRERDRIQRMSAQLDREISRQMRDGENYRGGARW